MGEHSDRDDAAASRRRALLIAGAAGVGSVAALAGAAPAAAAPNYLELENANAATVTTKLDIGAGTANPDEDPDGDPGLHLTTATRRTTLRVHSTHGNGILATCAHTDHSTAPVSAYGSHVGVYAQVNAETAPAVWGQAGGTGGRGVYGWGTGPDSVGVHGASSHGVGGVFEGTTANAILRPVPGAATHPSAGETGSFFVDQSGSLWFCKAGGDPATWVQLA
jgi:hypothetical protein